MIRTFKTKKLLFSPVGFLNSVAKWLLGVHSPTGTIRIRNTANPSEDGGPSIDIDSHEVARAIDPYIRASYPKVGVKKLLGASMKWENGQLEVDDNWLKARVIDNDSVDPSAGEDMPQDVAGEADKGTLDKCARADHVHKLDTDSSLSFTNGKLGVNFGTAEGTAAEGNHDHDGEYAEVDHTHDEYATTDHTHSEYAATDHTHIEYAPAFHAHDYSDVYASISHTHAEYALSDGLGEAAYADIGASGGVMAYDQNLDTLAGNLDSTGKLRSDGTMPSSAVSDANCTSNGNCLAYFKSDKTLGHLSATSHTATVQNTDAVTNVFSYSGNGSNRTATLKCTAVGSTSAPTTQKVVGFAANSTTASLFDAAVVDTSISVSDGQNLTWSNGKLVKDSNTYVKLASVNTGVLYATNGVLSFKGLNSNNGIAGLNASGKLSIGQIPTGTTASTVSIGNHTHAYGSSSLTGFGTAAACNSTQFASSGHTHDYSSVYAGKTHQHASSEITGLGTAATKDVGKSGGVMAYDEKINTLAAALTNDGKVKTSLLACDVAGHQNNCLLVAQGAVVTHSGNAMYNLLAAATEQDTKRATKIITDKDAPYIPGATGSKIVKTAASGGQLVESEDVCATFSSTPSGSKLVQSSGTSGDLAEVTIGDGLKLENSTLSPKFKSSGGLAADSGGLKLDSVGTVKKTLQLVVVSNEQTTQITLKLYGLEIDANGRVIGRAANPYKTIVVSPGF